MKLDNTSRISSTRSRDRRGHLRFTYTQRRLDLAGIFCSCRCLLAIVCVPIAVLLLSFALSASFSFLPQISVHSRHQRHPTSAASSSNTNPIMMEVEEDYDATGSRAEAHKPLYSSQQFRAHEIESSSSSLSGSQLPQGVIKFVLQTRARAASAPPGGVGDGGGGTSTTATKSSSPPSWRTLSFREVAGLWQTDSNFAETFAESLASVAFEAIFWESAPVTSATMDKPYEYVTVQAVELVSVSADGSPFAQYIGPGEGTTNVVSFRNLRGDCLLVSPCRGGPAEAYSHLAKFVRGAPRDQVVKFFSAVGAAVEAEVAARGDDCPVWLSTSGLGVYWLHARLDSTPKYYAYTPYKRKDKP